MKKNGVWEVILRIFIAAATAALTALGTTSCMGFQCWGRLIRFRRPFLIEKAPGVILGRQGREAS